MSQRLDGYRILILETREEAQFSRLLSERGASVMQCPMFAIRDAPDPAPVEAWIGRALAHPPDDMVFMTGEGLRRIMAVARRIGADAAFVASLAQARKFARGPKPVRALREIGLEAQAVTEKPTTEGVIATLAALDLAGRRVGLQLYPEKDHAPLIAAIESQGASVDPVTPYIYDAQAGADNIVAAIEEMAAGRIDAIALTSSGLVRRLTDTATARGLTARLGEALSRTRIASVGPVVSEELAAAGLRTDISPENESFFMRPLIAALEASLTRAPPRRPSTG
jgi:uroporphyrinogen-III synthase